MSDIDHEQKRDELAAYLLGALDPGEAAELERHVAGCEQCRDELERLRPVVQALPESVERVEPSARLRTRVMAEVRADAGEARARGRSATSDGRGRSLFLRPAMGVAAIVVLVAGIAAAYAVRDGSSGDGATTVAAGRAPGVTAEMVRDGDSGTLRLAGLRRLPSNEALQAWVQRGERIEPAGPLFEPHRDGTATTAIADMHGVSTVMVTAEPRSGSPSPTSEPLISVSVQ
jgi:anti-sigma-K factor RskA